MASQSETRSLQIWYCKSRYAFERGKRREFAVQTRAQESWQDNRTNPETPRYLSVRARSAGGLSVVCCRKREVAQHETTRHKRQLGSIVDKYFTNFRQEGEEHRDERTQCVATETRTKPGKEHERRDRKEAGGDPPLAQPLTKYNQTTA